CQLDIIEEKEEKRKETAEQSKQKLLRSAQIQWDALEIDIFVFSALAMGSAGEIAYIDDTLRKNGFGEQSLFCVVNRFDQLTSEREQQRLRKFSDNLLAPYTKHVYYTSAYKGLVGQLQNNPAMLDESKIPAVETALADYLA